MLCVAADWVSGGKQSQCQSMPSSPASKATTAVGADAAGSGAGVIPDMRSPIRARSLAGPGVLAGQPAGHASSHDGSRLQPSHMRTITNNNLHGKSPLGQVSRRGGAAAPPGCRAVNASWKVPPASQKLLFSPPCSRLASSRSQQQQQQEGVGDEGRKASRLLVGYDLFQHNTSGALSGSDTPPHGVGSQDADNSCSATPVTPSTAAPAAGSAPFGLAAATAESPSNYVTPQQRAVRVAAPLAPLHRKCLLAAASRGAAAAKLATAGSGSASDACNNAVTTFGVAESSQLVSPDQRPWTVLRQGQHLQSPDWQPVMVSMLQNMQQTPLPAPGMSGAETPCSSMPQLADDSTPISSSHTWVQRRLHQNNSDEARQQHQNPAHATLAGLSDVCNGHDNQALVSSSDMAKSCQLPEVLPLEGVGLADSACQAATAEASVLPWVTRASLASMGIHIPHLFHKPPAGKDQATAGLGIMSSHPPAVTPVSSSCQPTTACMPAGVTSFTVGCPDTGVSCTPLQHSQLSAVTPLHVHGHPQLLFAMPTPGASSTPAAALHSIITPGTIASINMGTATATTSATPVTMAIPLSSAGPSGSVTMAWPLHGSNAGVCAAPVFSAARSGSDGLSNKENDSTIFKWLNATAGTTLPPPAGAAGAAGVNDAEGATDGAPRRFVSMSIHPVTMQQGLGPKPSLMSFNNQEPSLAAVMHTGHHHLQGNLLLQQCDSSHVRSRLHAIIDGA